MGITPGDYSEKHTGPCLRKKQILFVGRLIPWKGVKYLISAMEKVIKNIPDSCLVIIGDGPERSSLEELCKKLHLSDYCQFLGFVDQTDLFSYYQNSAVFVLSSIMYNSQTEGLGVVLLEAMASGLPVIGSYVGGIPDIIQDGVNGLLVPPEDPDALSDAIIRVLTNPDIIIRYREEGKKTVTEQFSWTVVGERFIEVYYDFIQKLGKSF